MNTITTNGITPTDIGTVDKDTVDFISLGEKVASNFLVTILNQATFTAAMKAHPGVNGFDPARVGGSIAEVFDEASHVEFGAEGTPVLYIHIPHWTYQRNGAASSDMKRKYSAEERQELTQRIIRWAKSVGADEITTRQHGFNGEVVVNKPGSHPAAVRVWWD